MEISRESLKSTVGNRPAFVFTAVFLALVACTGPTKYTDRNAVNVEAIGSDSYKIEAVGNDRTPQITVYEFALLKAAEIALENGHIAFRILTRQGWSAERGYAKAPFYRGSAVRLRIKTAPMPDYSQDVERWYDARKVQERLGPELLGGEDNAPKAPAKQAMSRDPQSAARNLPSSKSDTDGLQPVTLEDKVKVLDAGTFVLGDRTVGLFGIDAPDVRQVCETRPMSDIVFHCGAYARTLVAAMVEEGLHCARQAVSKDGRTLVTCYNSNGQDIAAWMVTAGLAHASRGSAYKRLEVEARRREIGIWRFEFVAPTAWKTTCGGVAHLKDMPTISLRCRADGKRVGRWTTRVSTAL